MKKNLLLLLSFGMFYLPVSAQLWVDTTNYTAEQMIGDFFNTDLTTVSNITYTGSPGSMCFFEGSQSNLNLNAGLLITTGSYTNAAGMNDNESASTWMDVPGDADLSALVDNFPTFDAAVVEFDLIPTNDAINLKYVFGSEEYLEFVGSAFNDVFAFFISGGSEYPEPTNIALVPGTSTPVSINNVNQNLNTDYFFDNVGGTTLQYDGFTVPLQATASVTPGETYHIKIGITDASDAAFDSGVFLSVESLGGDSLLAPQPDFEALIASNTVSFSDQTLYATSWFWDFGDGTTSNERSPVHTFSEDLLTHQYIVSLTVNNYCCSQTKTIEIGEASVGTNIPAANEIKLTSNPGNGLFSVLNTSGKGVQYEISDMQGISLMKGYTNGDGQIDCTAFQSGFYLLKINFEGKSYTEKLIIQK